MKIEILPGIWISDSENLDSQFLEEKMINKLINIKNDLSFLGSGNKYHDMIRENMEKYEILKLVNYLKDITKFMKESVSHSENILIYSDPSFKKSPILILGFLIRYGLVNIEIAIEMIRTKIIDAFKPTLEYENAIKLFSEAVKK